MTGSERRPSKSKLSNLSFKHLRKVEAVADKRDHQAADGSCIVCVGSTGTGKSSTISRVTGSVVRSGSGPEPVTEHCQLYPGGQGQVWVDTVGWEDRHNDNTNIFQDTLRFLNNNDLLRLTAIVWCVSPNIRQDATLQRQAEFIDQFDPRNIWNNVIIIVKQSLNPAQDGSGAVMAANTFHRNAKLNVIGYRYLEDPTLTSEQRQLLEHNLETRKTFNVLTDEEIVSLLQQSISNLQSPVQVVFRDQRCVDCGEIGDKRLLSQYCHLDKCRKHPGRLQRVHPGGIELYHLSEDRICLHPGTLRSAWWLCGDSGKWSCCQKSKLAEGCKKVGICCRNEEGCRRRHSCCKRPTDFSSGGAGCELIYNCCRLGPDTEGCKDFCVKCGREWGKPAGHCYRKDHNLVNI